MFELLIRLWHLFEVALQALCGWLYLCSPNYRAKTQDRWRSKPGEKLPDILAMTVGVCVTSLVGWLVFGK